MTTKMISENNSTEPESYSGFGHGRWTCNTFIFSIVKTQSHQYVSCGSEKRRSITSRNDKK
jgi:hypothetical protein